MGRADVLELCPSGVLRSPGLLATGVAPGYQAAGPGGDDDDRRAEREAEGERGEPRAVEETGAEGERERRQAHGPGPHPAMAEQIGEHERGDDAEREREQVQKGHDSSITSPRTRTRWAAASSCAHRRRYGVPCLPRDLGHNRVPVVHGRRVAST